MLATTGVRSWRFDYRLAGVRETLTIGRYPEVTLERARDDLREARKLLAKGISPARAKQERLVTEKVARKNTLKAFGEDWFDTRSKSRSESWRDNARR